MKSLRTLTFYQKKLFNSVLQPSLFNENKKTVELLNPNKVGAWGFSLKTLSTNVPRPQHQSSESYSIEEIEVPNGHQYGYKIACKVWKGSGKPSDKNEPPIICVHGWLDNANSFDALLPKLIRPGRTFYALDLPGHGLSSHLHTTHYNSHVESHVIIHRVARHLKLDKFSLIGHSMGAEAATMYSASFPDNVHKLITIDGVCPQLPDWVQSTQLFVNSLFEIEDLLKKSPFPSPTTYEELLGRMTKARAGNMVTEAGCRILLKRGAQKVPDSAGKFRFSHDLKLRMFPGLALLMREQMAQFCAAVKAPLCVIKAGANDPFSKQASKDFQAIMESAASQNSDMKVEFHVVDGNHHVHLNEPDKIVQIVARFLDNS